MNCSVAPYFGKVLVKGRQVDCALQWRIVLSRRPLLAHQVAPLRSKIGDISSICSTIKLWLNHENCYKNLTKMYISGAKHILFGTVRFETAPTPCSLG